MLLVNRDPWDLFDKAHHSLNNLAQSGSYKNNWYPAVDIKEEKEKFLITADV
ncbi:MAG: heat-shock protein Hsp20, partial [Legionellales bacterium]|nr:heat-shock protein Hsp20 [Legionellales bacterium]